MPSPRRIVALLVAALLALPATAAAQTQTVPTQSPGASKPPVTLDGSSGGSRGSGSSASASGSRRSLPDTGSDPRLLLLAGVALTLLGAGLRLLTADADLY